MMSHRIARTFVAFSFALLGAACGGKVFVDTPGAGGAGGAGTTGSTSSSSFSSTVGSSATGTGPVGTTASVGTGQDTTAVSSSVTTTSSGGSTATVFCSGMPCNAGQVCCFNPNGPGDHCGASGNCDPGFVELSCNSPDDCPGSICCASLSADLQSLTGIACQSSCGADNELVVCTQMQSNVCPSGTACHQKQQLGTGSGYRFCVGP